MDKMLHYHVESGSTLSGPTLNIKCAQRDEMLRYVDGWAPIYPYSEGRPTLGGYMKGTIKGEAYKFLFFGHQARSTGYEYAEVRVCAASQCA